MRRSCAPRISIRSGSRGVGQGRERVVHQRAEQEAEAWRWRHLHRDPERRGESQLHDPGARREDECLVRGAQEEVSAMTRSFPLPKISLTDTQIRLPYLRPRRPPVRRLDRLYAPGASPGAEGTRGAAGGRAGARRRALLGQRWPKEGAERRRGQGRRHLGRGDVG